MLKQKADNKQEIAKESISLTTVFVIVGILFMVLCFALFFFRYSPNSPIYHLYFKAPAVLNLADYLKGETSKINSGNTAEIKITEEQMAKSICLDCTDFPLKKGKVAIDTNGILLSGKTAAGFWGLRMEFLLMPKIDGFEGLTFEISEVKAAGVTAPPKLTEKLNPQIEALFINAIPRDESLELSEVHLMVGYLLLEGKKK